ncbi:MAG: PIG-L family deacetylase [Burkholderiaceae bacterium]
MKPYHLLRQADAARTWLDGLGVRHLLLISPHLDDAVFSAAGLLRAAADRSTVLTVFTEGTPGDASAWTRAAGFADTPSEFAARRAEDLRAARHLSGRFIHAGLHSGQLDDVQARHHIARWLGENASTGEDTLVLLPAGAGGQNPYTAWTSWRTRLLRRPFGAPAHGEHGLVRDLFWHALADRPCRAGFYADLPYVWKQGDRALHDELVTRHGGSLTPVRLQPDVADKLAAAACYTSQMPLVFGQQDAYRRRALGRHECYFLADPA